jgi:hypothetical protein
MSAFTSVRAEIVTRFISWALSVATSCQDRWKPCLERRRALALDGDDREKSSAAFPPKASERVYPSRAVYPTVRSAGIFPVAYVKARYSSDTKALIQKTEVRHRQQSEPTRDPADSSPTQTTDGVPVNHSLHSDILAVLLCGGDKRTQDADSKRAIEIAKYWKE